MAVPADADVLNWINVLDYAMPNNGSSTQVSLPAGTSTVTFSLPVGINLNLADILVRTTSSDLSIKIGNYDLTSVTVDTSYAKRIRFYGFVGGVQYQNITLTVTTSTSCTLFFDKFIVSPLWWADFMDIGQYIFNYVGTESTFIQESTEGIAGNTFGANETGLNPFNIALSCANWEKYDYLRFDLLIRCMEITSITALFGSDEISCSVTQIYDGSADLDTWYLEVTIDLSALSRSAANSDPEVFLCGTGRGGSQNFIRLMQTVGFIEAEVDLQNHFYSGWFGQFLSELQSIVSGTDNIWLELRNINQYIKTIPSAISGFFTTQTSAIEDALIGLQSSIRGMFTSLYGWITEQTDAISDKFDELISVFNPEVDTSVIDSLEDQTQALQDFENTYLPVVRDFVTDGSLGDYRLGRSFTSSFSFIRSVFTAVFSNMGILSYVYTIPVIIGLFFFLCSHVSSYSSSRPKHHSSKKSDGQIS